MGILSRASYIIKSKLNSVLNRAEDPTETLDYSYEQLRDEEQKVKDGITDLTEQKKRLEIQRDNLQEEVEHHNEQAREAVKQDRDDLAERALTKKKGKMSQIEDLNAQISDLQRQQDALVEKKNELQTRIEEFRTKKETMKAKHEAAEASVRVGEAMTGAGDEFSDVNRAIERAEENTKDMEARSAAMTELQETGALEGALDDEDSIDKELNEMHTDSEVAAELETLKEETGVDTGSDNGEATDNVESVSETDPEPATEMETDSEGSVEKS